MPGGANYKNPLTKEQKRQSHRAKKRKTIESAENKALARRKEKEAWLAERKKKDAEWDKKRAAHKAKHDSTRASNDKKKSVYDAMMKQKMKQKK